MIIHAGVVLSTLKFKSLYNVCISFFGASLPLNILPSSHKIVLQVLGISPLRVHIIILIIRLKFLHLLLFSMPTSHHLLLSRLINNWLPHGRTSPLLGQLYNNFGLFVFSNVVIQGFALVVFFADCPKSRLFGIEEVNGVCVALLQVVFALCEHKSCFPLSESGVTWVGDLKCSSHLRDNILEF